MAISPKIFYIMAVIAGLLTGALAFFDHESFVSGILVGIGGAAALAFLGIGVLRQKLEVQMEAAQAQIGEMMGVDVEQLLSSKKPQKN